MNKILTTENILSLLISFFFHGEVAFIIGNLNVHRWFKISYVGSNTTHRLREKFVIIHRGKARNLDQLSFSMIKYL